jgi:hypothetical protein
VIRHHFRLWGGFSGTGFGTGNFAWRDGSNAQMSAFRSEAEAVKFAVLTCWDITKQRLAAQIK